MVALTPTSLWDNLRARYHAAQTFATLAVGRVAVDLLAAAQTRCDGHRKYLAKYAHALHFRRPSQTLMGGAVAGHGFTL